MVMSDAGPKHGGSGGGELEKRVTAVEARVGGIEKTMVTTEVFQRELGTVRGEIGALRDELHVGLAAVRDELHVGLAAVRGEIAGLRGEVRSEIAGLRGDVRSEIAGLRGDVRSEIAGLRGEMRAEIAKIPFELVKWLIALAGIAAAIMTTIYNIWFR